MKQEETQKKAQESHIGTIYAYLNELKVTYAQYEDLIVELRTENEGSTEIEVPEEKHDYTKKLAKMLRQYLTLIDIEYRTLVQMKRITPDKTIETIYAELRDPKKSSYFPDGETAKKYIIALNALLLPKITEGQTNYY